MTLSFFDSVIVGSWKNLVAPISAALISYHLTDLHIFYCSLQYLVAPSSQYYPLSGCLVRFVNCLFSFTFTTAIYRCTFIDKPSTVNPGPIHLRSLLLLSRRAIKCITLSKLRPFKESLRLTAEQWIRRRHRSEAAIHLSRRAVASGALAFKFASQALAIWALIVFF